MHYKHTEVGEVLGKAGLTADKLQLLQNQHLLVPARMQAATVQGLMAIGLTYGQALQAKLSYPSPAVACWAALASLLTPEQLDQLNGHGGCVVILCDPKLITQA